MQDRRKFIEIISKTATAAAFMPSVVSAGMAGQFRRTENFLPSETASDESFWNSIRKAYIIDKEIINFNNGGVSPQPVIVQKAFEKLYEKCNHGPSYYMWRIIDQGREPLRARLAALAGCDKEELAINRNTTEALATVIFGLDLKPGDEVVLSRMDYPNMIHAWQQRESRDGIKLNWIDLHLPIEDENEIVKKYTEAFTDKTKIVHITHIINWTGQIVPAKRIAAQAHQRGIEVILDAAHSFAHIDFKISDINCDYAGTSLHKWLCAPFGSGFLFVKKEKIKTLYPLFPNDKPGWDNIRKFEVLGTRSFATEQSINNAIDFHQAIGIQRKEERLRYLKNYWCEKVKDVKGIRLNTSLNKEFSCAIAQVEIEGMKGVEFEKRLLKEYKVHTSPVVWEYLNGVRIAPNVYTNLKDLDILVEAIKTIAADNSKKSR